MLEWSRPYTNPTPRWYARGERREWWMLDDDFVHGDNFMLRSNNGIIVGPFETVEDVMLFAEMLERGRRLTDAEADEVLRHINATIERQEV
jgi:hypothetical protein